MCTHFLHCIHPSTPFPHHLLPSHWCQLFPLGRSCSSLLFFNFVEEKKRTDKMKNMIF
jgi:hypothetical protein